MSSDEYILADKAYQLSPPTSCLSLVSDLIKAFNKAHSEQRIRGSKSSLGVIRDDVQKDHTRAIRWIMACLVWHNYLSFRGEDDD